jgi:hypothetical protein
VSESFWWSGRVREVGFVLAFGANAVAFGLDLAYPSLRSIAWIPALALGLLSGWGSALAWVHRRLAKQIRDGDEQLARTKASTEAFAALATIPGKIVAAVQKDFAPLKIKCGRCGKEGFCWVLKGTETDPADLPRLCGECQRATETSPMVR